MTERAYLCQSNRYLEKKKKDDGSGNKHVYRHSCLSVSGFLCRFLTLIVRLLDF